MNALELKKYRDLLIMEIEKKLIIKDVENLHAACRISDDLLQHELEKIADKEELEDYEVVAAVVNSIIEQQGGVLFVVDDERSLAMITHQQGIFLFATTLRAGRLGMEMVIQNNTLRHVFFDYWLSDKDTVMDIVFTIVVEGSEYTEVTPDNKFTYSVHSADSSAKDRIAEYIPAQLYKEYKSPF